MIENGRTFSHNHLEQRFLTLFISLSVNLNDFKSAGDHVVTIDDCFNIEPSRDIDGLVILIHLWLFR